MNDLIKREDAIEAVENVTWYHQNRNKDMVEGANSDEHQAWYKSQDIYEALEAVPSADRPSAVYEYLKRKIGDIVDSETEFDSWFKRMVWHVEECNRLADKPQGEWIDAEIPLEGGGSMPIQACSLCKTFYPLAYTGGGHRFCPSCRAHMKGADDE